MLHTRQTLQLVLRSYSKSWGTEQVSLMVLPGARSADQLPAFHGVQRQASSEKLSGPLEAYMFLMVPVASFQMLLLSMLTAKVAPHPESYSGMHKPDPRGKTCV